MAGKYKSFEEILKIFKDNSGYEYIDLVYGNIFDVTKNVTPYLDRKGYGEGPVSKMNGARPPKDIALLESMMDDALTYDEPEALQFLSDIQLAALLSGKEAVVKTEIVLLALSKKVEKIEDKKEQLFWISKIRYFNREYGKEKFPEIEKYLVTMIAKSPYAGIGNIANLLEYADNKEQARKLYNDAYAKLENKFEDEVKSDTPNIKEIEDSVSIMKDMLAKMAEKAFISPTEKMQAEKDIALTFNLRAALYDNKYITKHKENKAAELIELRANQEKMNADKEKKQSEIEALQAKLKQLEAENKSLKEMNAEQATKLQNIEKQLQMKEGMLKTQGAINDKLQSFIDNLQNTSKKSEIKTLGDNKPAFRALKEMIENFNPNR